MNDRFWHCDALGKHEFSEFTEDYSGKRCHGCGKTRELNDLDRGELRLARIEDKLDQVIRALNVVRPNPRNDHP